MGLDRYGDREPALLAAYVNFLQGAADSARCAARLTGIFMPRLQRSAQRARRALAGCPRATATGEFAIAYMLHVDVNENGAVIPNPAEVLPAIQAVRDRLANREESVLNFRILIE